MNNLEIKYSSELAQIRNIIGDNLELSMFILRECAEDVGIASVSDYCEVLGVSKRTIQDRLKKDKMDYINISGIKFPCINI